MPQALPILGNIALNLAVGIGLSVVSSLLQPQQAQGQQAAVQGGFSGQMTVGQSRPVTAIFGLGVASGNLVYANSYGDNNEYLQLLVDIGFGEHEGLFAFLIDKKPRTLSGSNDDPRGRSVDDYTVDGTPYMWVKFYTGAPGQAADPELIARANPSGRWGDMHKATGHAYLIVTLRDNADLYPSSFPEIGSVWKGLKLYDWRKDSTMPGGSGAHRWGDPSTYEWSDNPYVIRWNWRRGIYVGSVRVLGLGYPSFAQQLAYYTAAANLSDESVFDPVTGTTFSRYVYGREINDGEDKMSILAEIDDCCCGTSCKIGGADAPLPAAQQISVGTLTDNDRIDGATVTADRWGLVSGKKTAWAGQYVSPDTWQPVPYQTRINTDLEALIGGRRTQPLNQPYETLEARAQMRAEIAARRQSFAGTRTETFGPKARQYQVGDCITRACSWGDIAMIVTGRALTDDRLGVTLMLLEWDNSIVPASGDTFVIAPPAPGTGPASPSRMVTVANPTAEAYPVEGGGATHPGIRFGCDEITDQSVDNWIVRFWPSAGTEAADGKTLTGTRLDRVLVTADVAPETAYTYKMTVSTTPYRATVWTAPQTVTTGSESVPVGDGTITQAKLVLQLQAKVNFFQNAFNDLFETVNSLSSTVQDQDIANLADKRQVLFSLKSQIGSVTAQVASVAETAAEANAATASIATAAQATADAGTATGLVKMQVDSSPGGVAVTVGQYLSTETTGGTTSAMETLEIDNAGVSTKTIVADLVHLTNTAGTALFEWDSRTGNWSVGDV